MKLWAYSTMLKILNTGSSKNKKLLQGRRIERWKAANLHSAYKL